MIFNIPLKHLRNLFDSIHKDDTVDMTVVNYMRL